MSSSRFGEAVFSGATRDPISFCLSPLPYLACLFFIFTAITLWSPGCCSPRDHIHIQGRKKGDEQGQHQLSLSSRASQRNSPYIWLPRLSHLSNLVCERGWQSVQFSNFGNGKWAKRRGLGMVVEVARPKWLYTLALKIHFLKFEVLKLFSLTVFFPSKQSTSLVILLAQFSMPTASFPFMLFLMFYAWKNASGFVLYPLISGFCMFCSILYSTRWIFIKHHYHDIFWVSIPSCCLQ